jgi:hypothetical protein
MWLPAGMILFSGFVMCLQLYLAGKKMKRCYSEMEKGIREDQPAGVLFSYPGVYMGYRRIKGKSHLKIIAMGPARSKGRFFARNVQRTTRKIYAVKYPDRKEGKYGVDNHTL